MYLRGPEIYKQIVDELLYRSNTCFGTSEVIDVAKLLLAEFSIKELSRKGFGKLAGARN
ncbi:MAG: hypothetical protein A49_32790 [Methyloceanibacter sp.]|nr:MAG: hypothetical protein A49_32790 [Methyloceanibacter sp.]